ncbi:MBL fold metallo-hydrolase [Rubrobacter xylanophilus]|uniref:MBL fold metallo-hydrolase n=1 Tax=Rubrobacter xylanophilus TaxID=49319 RepID=A0A510HHE5_9ACTN|nr:MBL fold metallo-hydrolase [Rubrobacter xylanophilus]BBL78685.1 MBL fold metallo-hydrolase [Rubrobacter xylanophilus]
MTVVGSGTVVPNPERRQSCVAVECGGELIVFDLGSGALRGMLRAGLDPLEVDRVFLTHFHPDHTVDLPALLFTARYGSESPRTRPLHVCGPEPFAAFWDSLSGAWGEWISGDYLRITELPHGGGHLELPGGPLSWGPVPHRPESVGYRLAGDRGDFVYTGDTSYGEPVVALARGAHTLLTECSFPDESPVEGHLTPSGAATAAREAGVRRLVLTHLYPKVDTPELPERVRAAGFDGEVAVARDGMTLEV